MAGLDVRLLGDVTIRRDGEVVPCTSAKARELLGLLVSRRGHPLDRDAVADVLWPDEPPDTTRRHLRQVLWRLRAALTGPPFLQAVQAGRLQVDVGAFASIDLVTLEEAHAATADVAGADLSDRQAAMLEAAAAAYGGEFLAGCHQDWCLPERARLQEIHLSVRDQLVEYCERRGLVARAVAHGRVALDREPARETTHRLLMLLHHRRGDRAAALRQYRRCVEALAAEFGVGPSAPTALLHRRIRADSRDEARLPADGQAAPAGAREIDRTGPDRGLAEIAEVHQRLAEIQATLDTLLRAVGQGNPGGGRRLVRPPARQAL